MKGDLDRRLRRNESGLVAGIDEAGRGALAGPVVAACVIFPDNPKPIPGLDDSKKLKPHVRERLFVEIKKHARAYAIALVGNQRVDLINIRQASFEAMKKAASRLTVKPALVLVDGFEIPGLGLRQQGIIKGDRKSSSIAAASILAKVTRDRIMGYFNDRYPAYNFSRHKGYPTPEHKQKLAEFGPCPIHRRSYAPVKQALKTVSIEEDG